MMKGRGLPNIQGLLCCHEVVFSYILKDSILITTINVKEMDDNYNNHITIHGKEMKVSPLG